MAATVITRLIAEVESSTEPDGYQFEVFIPISEDEVGRIKRANEGDELRASMDRAIKKTLPTTLQRSFRYSHATYRTAEKGYGFLFLIQA